MKDTLLSKSEGKGGVIKGSVGDPFDKYGKRIFLLKISFTLREKSVLLQFTVLRVLVSKPIS